MRAASPLGQHVATSPPMGMQGPSGQGQAQGPYAPPPDASRPGPPPMGGAPLQQQPPMQSPPPPSAGASGPPQGAQKAAPKLPAQPKYRELLPLSRSRRMS
jgi:hypothetical protein